MLKSTKFKTRALILITAVGLVGTSQFAFAHTRLKTPEIAENSRHEQRHD